METKKQTIKIIIAGVIIGAISSILVLLGNPKNMGFCIACFIRDTVGALGLHRAEAVQYIRPEIIGIVIGSTVCALCFKEFKPKGGSCALTRFVLGFCVMIGCLMFLGCPFRMIIRIAGGDLNAIVGLIGFAAGILLGAFFLNKGYTLGRTIKQNAVEGAAFTVWQVILAVLLIAAPTFIFFTEADGGPGAKHAAIAVSLIAGVLVGALAQRTRLCMVGGIRDIVLFKDFKLIAGFAAILVSCLICNLILSAVTESAYFTLGFAEQPVAHSDGIWNALGMLLVGFGCVLLGGCPLRQLVLSGEGNSDSAVTILGLGVGAAFAHNFGLASSAKGPTGAGKAGVIIALVIVTVIACTNTFKKGDAGK